MKYERILRIEEAANQPYTPSNGTEGMYFTDAFCDNCLHQHPDPNKGQDCDILMMSLCGEQPDEWNRDDEGYPFCSEFQKWDWGNGDDPDGWNDPPEHPDPDPNQLWIPFDALELLGIEPGTVVVTKRAIVEVA